MNYTTGIITFDFNDNAMSLAANSKIIFADIWSLQGDEYLNYFIICWIEDIENNSKDTKYSKGSQRGTGTWTGSWKENYQRNDKSASQRVKS